MKRAYERPQMMIDVYETNAYCNGCGTTIKTGQLVLDANSTYNRTNNGGNNWTAEDGYVKTDLYHTFTNSSIYQTVDGNCTGGSTGGKPGQSSNRCSNDSQSIWKCTCHPDNPWYLEWSHNYSVHFNNGADTFFLYQETTGNNSFNIAGDASPWPGSTNGSDMCVAQVVFQEGTSVVDNS